MFVVITGSGMHNNYISSPTSFLVISLGHFSLIEFVLRLSGVHTRRDSLDVNRFDGVIPDQQ